MMGMGHAVYHTEDPRATILRGICERLADRTGDRRWCELSKAIEQATKEEFRKLKGKEIYPERGFLQRLGLPYDGNSRRTSSLPSLPFRESRVGPPTSSKRNLPRLNPNPNSTGLIPIMSEPIAVPKPVRISLSKGEQHEFRIRYRHYGSGSGRTSGGR